MIISANSSGATEIRTRETLLTFTRFPGVPLQRVFCLFIISWEYLVFLLQVCCKFYLKPYILKGESIARQNKQFLLHICDAKLRTFNHICKFFGRFFSFASRASSSTSRSSSDSRKYGHVNTPIVSASRYTWLNNLPRSCSEDGIDVGMTVRRRHPHPRQSFVRRHHSRPVRSEQQLSMFESICYPL